MNIEDFIIDEESSMLEAMKLLDKVAKKVLFIENQGKLTAAITDGDIRRWILKKGNLDAKVKEVANYKPKFLNVKDKTIAREYMKSNSVEALPLVDDNLKIESILFWNDQEINKCKQLNIPVVIMAGGLGTRLYPYTKILPKPLIPIGEIPIAEHIINRLNKHGCNDFYLIVNHKKNMIKSYFNEIVKNYQIHFIDENTPLGTGGGLSLLKGQIIDTFILTNCDIIIDEDYERIYQYHVKEKNVITMVCSLKKIKIPYGVIEVDGNGMIQCMKEKPELSFFTNTGFYIVEPTVIDNIDDNISIGFPDIIEKYRNKGEKIGIYPITEDAWMDMGQFDGMEQMRARILGESRCQ